VCKVANVLLAWGVRRGDAVAVYLPMMPDLAFVMLACARIGAVHSVIFAGFSADSVRDRVVDAGCKWVVTADEGMRGGRRIALKATVDTAVAQAQCVVKVFVYANTGADVPLGLHDVPMAPALASAKPFCPAVAMDAEDTLFLLYTSGSTGKPKGLAHTTGGYLLYAAVTHKLVFDVRPGDVYACVADAGWITGHTYIVYGPLANGATTLMFESTPLYPDASRYWDLVERHRITQLYTAPTAIRALMRLGDAPVKKHDLSSLRVLGSVGEPINPEAWRWYHDVVGGGRCAVVDTFWQTETGGHIVTPLPGATPTKPGSATLPFFGVDVALLGADGAEVLGNDVSGIIAVRAPWPGMARSIHGDHARFLDTYLKPFPGFYLTGDGGVRDVDGYLWVTGRVDDVLNVSGHRLGSAEIESALVLHRAVAEAAVIGFPHEAKGEGICCYVTLKAGVEETRAVADELKLQVRKIIGPFATPDLIILSSGLPKTRSGKIMRRVLRKIVARQTDQLGDISTLADVGVVAELIAKVEAALGVKLPPLKSEV
jgi:acetyl-CoA synthetase